MPPFKPEPSEQERMAANFRAWLDLMDFQAAVALEAIRHDLGPDADPWPEFRRRWAAGSEEHHQANRRILERLARRATDD